jgi:hypothetical protein
MCSNAASVGDDLASTRQRFQRWITHYFGPRGWNNPGLELANAFGVSELELANGFEVSPLKQVNALRRFQKNLRQGAIHVFSNGDESCKMPPR